MYSYVKNIIETLCESIFLVWAGAYTFFFTLATIHIILTVIWNIPLRIYEKATGKVLPALFIRVSETLELLNPIDRLAELEVHLLYKRFKRSK